jgi:hypothetical protein
MRHGPQLSLTVLVFLFACEGKVRPTYHIVVRVESDPGTPLSGAELSREGRRLATTDDHGMLTATLKGNPGDKIPLTVACPAGYRTPLEPLSVLLRAAAERGKHPEFRVRGPPLTRNLVVAVRATNGPDLPLRYLGQEIARTDATGAAHALLRAAPGDALALTLDTSAPEHAQLMPQHPELKINVPERDELVVFDQTFTRPKPKIKRHKRLTPPPAEPVGPVRI